MGSLKFVFSCFPKVCLIFSGPRRELHYVKSFSKNTTFVNNFLLSALVMNVNKAKKCCRWGSSLDTKTINGRILEAIKVHKSQVKVELNFYLIIKSFLRLKCTQRVLFYISYANAWLCINRMENTIVHIAHTINHHETETEIFVFYSP